MRTILYSTWEPGLTGNTKSSGGGAAWTKYLWGFLETNGYSIVAPGITNPDSVEPTQPVDAAIFCWRWLLPDAPQYKERNLLYDRQNYLIGWCFENAIPVVIHDQDLKMLSVEREWLKKNGAIIATPSLFPETGEISLHFPNPYEFEPLIQGSTGLTYIGNNYERLDQTFKLIEPFAHEVHTTFYGNWIEPGYDRDPSVIKGLLPNVHFMGRLPQEDVITTLRKAKATVMLHKPEYGPRGFVTIRWAEAASAGVLPFIPAEFNLPNQYIYSLSRLRVSESAEMLEAYNQIGENERKKLIYQLRRFVVHYMSPVPWIKLLERIIV
jgi:glycosyltransferase involved in cell wall biosynthesis